jgi:hypothetical protein
LVESLYCYTFAVESHTLGHLFLEQSIGKKALNKIRNVSKELRIENSREESASWSIGET